MKKRTHTSRAACAAILACLPLFGLAIESPATDGMQVLYLKKGSATTENLSASWTAAINGSSPRSEMLEVGPGVSPEFTQEIEQAISKVPPNVLRALSRSGCRISLTKTIVEAVPEALNQQVRGYEPQTKWKSLFGMFNRKTNKVIMAEFAAAESADHSGDILKPLKNSALRRGIIRHEFGHATDQYLYNFSHTAQFKQAYNKGMASISRPERAVLAYYLQPGDAGKEETFAELFACLEEPACDRGSDLLLKNHFSELVKMIKEKVSAID